MTSLGATGFALVVNGTDANLDPLANRERIA
jgi:hypothetical protein